MIEVYKTNPVTKKLENINTIEKGSWINMIKPNKEEIEYISKKLNIEEQLLKYPLDLLEKPHIDHDDTAILIDIDVPITENKNGKRVYTTIPMGMVVVHDEYFITIASEKISAIDEIINDRKRISIDTEKKIKICISNII